MERLSTHQGELFRLLDPWGAGVGFMAPLFRRRQINTPFQQVVQDGVVVGFERLERETYEGTSTEERSVAVGDPAIWAFSFGGEDIVIGQGVADIQALAARLDDDLFQTRPMLAVEVAEFVDRPEARTHFARRAYDRLRSASPAGAAAWRDLSILTPDVIARLRTLPPEILAQTTPDLRRVVVSVQAGALWVRGVDDDRHPLVKGPVIDAILKTFTALGPLYSDVEKNPPLTFVRQKDEREESGLPILLVHPALKQLEPVLRARLSESPLFRNVRGGPKTVSVAPFDADPDAAPMGEAHFVLRPGGVLSDEERSWIERLPPWATIVDAPHGLDRRFGDNPAVTLLHNAIHAVTCVQALQATEALAAPSFYFQTAGVGPHPALDGLCQLYGRVAKLGLVGAPGLRFQSMTGRDDWHFEGEAETMFPHMRPVDIPPPNRTRRRGVTGGLIRYEPQPEQQTRRMHRQVVERVLIGAGWRIPDPGDPRGPGRTLFVQGELGGFDCDTVALEPIAPSQPGWFPYRLAEPLRAERVVVTEGATGAETLRHLTAHNQLLVSVRDVALSRPDFLPLIGLLSGQIRRFVSNLASREREPYLAMIVNMALSEGRGSFAGEGLLRDFVHSEGFGGALQIICRSVAYGAEATTARMRLLERRAPRDFPPALDFAVVFDRDGLVLRADGQDDP